MVMVEEAVMMVMVEVEMVMVREMVMVVEGVMGWR